jgi:hypothetical protein
MILIRLTRFYKLKYNTMKRITKKQYRNSARTASTAEVKPRPNEDRAVTLALRKSRRDDTLLTVCFSLRWTNDVSDYVIAKGDGARIVSTTANNQRNRINQINHSSDIQFIIKVKRRKPKSRSQRVGIKYKIK